VQYEKERQSEWTLFQRKQGCTSISFRGGQEPLSPPKHLQT
jgi:hypothetical protein